ncbi:MULTISPECIES: hypothetical protein [Stenotrophomonas]|uniref:hypothetical protein n=1 Tax=Stenotrophomonas TaxID=40323 RepID=UPI001311BBAD|nr:MULTISPECIES: hypothetical protein [Stenotrophomonas]MDH0275300.1 hypothetical protein [Stenotrophomonas sp. GD04089]MDH1913108.1 hypothetical protein [Stenotrophomonas sp. GD03794]
MQRFNGESWPAPDMLFGLVLSLSSPERDQFHVAVFFRDEVGAVLMYGDLQWHLRARCSEAVARDRYIWVCPRLGEFDQILLASKAKIWLENNPDTIPYSVSHPMGGVMFKDDKWAGEAPGMGLTCATFVVALFDELGIPFIDSSSWQERDGDAEWKSEILMYLRNCPGVAPEHVEAQMNSLGATVRIRPSDVFAAGRSLTGSETRPGLCFELVSRQVGEVEDLLRSFQ